MGTGPLRQSWSNSEAEGVANFCSLLVLKAALPVLVFANKTGLVFHAILTQVLLKNQNCRVR